MKSILKRLFSQNKEKEIKKTIYTDQTATKLQEVGKTTSIEEVNKEAEAIADSYKEIYIPLTKVDTIKKLYFDILKTTSFSVDINYFNQEYVRFNEERGSKNIDSITSAFDKILQINKLENLYTTYLDKVIRQNESSSDVLAGKKAEHYFKKEDYYSNFDLTFKIIGEKLLVLIDESMASALDAFPSKKEELRMISLLMVFSFYKEFSTNEDLQKQKQRFNNNVDKLGSSFDGICPTQSLKQLLLSINDLFLKKEFWRVAFYSVLQNRQIEIEMEEMADKQTYLYLAKIDVILTKASTSKTSMDDNINRKGILQNDTPNNMFDDFISEVVSPFAIQNADVKSYYDGIESVVKSTLNKLLESSVDDANSMKLRKIIDDKSFSLVDIEELKPLIDLIKIKEKEVIKEVIVEKEVAPKEVAPEPTIVEDFGTPTINEEDIDDLDFDDLDIDEDFGLEEDFDFEEDTLDQDDKFSYTEDYLYKFSPELVDQHILGWEDYKVKMSSLFSEINKNFINGKADLKFLDFDMQNLFNKVESKLLDNEILYKYTFEDKDYYTFIKDKTQWSDLKNGGKNAFTEFNLKCFGFQKDYTGFKIADLISLHDNNEHGLAIYHTALKNDLNPYEERSAKKIKVQKLDMDLYNKTVFSTKNLTKQGQKAKFFSIHPDLVCGSEWIEVENITKLDKETLDSKRYSTLQKVEKYLLLNTLDDKDKGDYNFKSLTIYLASSDNSFEQVNTSNGIRVEQNLLEFFKNFITKKTKELNIKNLDIKIEILKKG